MYIILSYWSISQETAKKMALRSLATNFYSIPSISLNLLTAAFENINRKCLQKAEVPGKELMTLQSSDLTNVTNTKMKFSYA